MFKVKTSPAQKYPDVFYKKRKGTFKATSIFDQYAISAREIINICILLAVELRRI